jgi:sialic acid synthase SpsE
MVDDPNECREQAELVPKLLRALQKIQQTFEEWISRGRSEHSCSVALASLAIAFGAF